MIARRGVLSHPGVPGPDLQADFGKALHKARRKAGPMQTKLADLSGLTQQYVAKIEAGRRTLATMAAIAAVLQIEVDEMPQRPSVATG
jgi:transcriptional regulator with XRE-family HTH domain